MKKVKNHTVKIIDAYITAVVVIISMTLVASGIAITRINTEYLETGIRSAKIIAERESMQILLTQNNSVLFPQKNGLADAADRVLTFLPPPVNTVYLTLKEFKSASENSSAASDND